MAKAIEHRGPDDSGYWYDSDSHLVFAHQRLSIIDLSRAGHQPMTSHDLRFTIVFNGEIYNHRTLRDDLNKTSRSAVHWQGNSDTEVFLTAIECWGIETALSKVEGMFAFALWDSFEKKLWFARDRFGEKPLYLGLTSSSDTPSLLFSSDLAAITKWPTFKNQLDISSLLQYVRFASISSPNCIYKGFISLPAGHLLSIPLDGAFPSSLPSPKQWWSATDVASAALANPFTDPQLAISSLTNALEHSVSNQSSADVPLGTFLSGGIDSSLITALLQSQQSSPVTTFSIGFEDASFNEAPYARKISEILGTNHIERYLTASDALEIIPSIPSLYSEPFADSSQLPTHLVCREARRAGLTVALTGDGGDELFGGYNRYLLAPIIWSIFKHIPEEFRQFLAASLRLLSVNAWDFLSRPFPISQFGSKIYKVSDRLRHVNSSFQLYSSLVSLWHQPLSILSPEFSNEFIEHSSPLNTSLPECFNSSFQAQMMILDTLNYLPNDILAKVDRASMAVGFETRAPFLNSTVFDTAWRIPMEMKIKPNFPTALSKNILRNLLSTHIPSDLIDRPKSGFGVPISSWLRGPLREWASDLLSPACLNRHGIFSSQEIHTLWSQHLNNSHDHSEKLWTILMWQAWYLEWQN